MTPDQHSANDAQSAPTPPAHAPRQGEPAIINGERAVRFEQSPGFFHYVALCRTGTRYTHEMPALPPSSSQTEPAVCWYVKASKTAAGTGGASQEADGKLVVSANHVRFIPRNPQFASLYMDLLHEEVRLKHEPGQPYATLEGDDLKFTFRFSKLCLECAPGTPVRPGLVPAMLDQEFGLVDAGIRHFDSMWQQVHALAFRPAAVPAATHPAAPDSTLTEMPPSTSTRNAPADPAPHILQQNEHVSPAEAPHPPVSGAQRLRPVKIAPNVASGRLLKKIPPVYPLEAKLVRLEGTVLLRAMIEKNGEIAEVYAVSGPPLLETAAVDAVRQWQYKPYSVNGQAVDVETTIEVVFALDGRHAATRAQIAK